MLTDKSKENILYTVRKIFQGTDLKNHQRGRNNQHVEEKIRQTCQQLVKAGLLVHPVRGTWQLAA